MRWIYTPLPVEKIGELSRNAGISPVLAELVLRTGVTETAAATKFLNPGLSELSDPFLLRNVEAGAARERDQQRCARALPRGENGRRVVG